MEFKSQICTTRQQSERLLVLGLKKETADMVHCAYNVDSGMAIRPFRWLSFSQVDMENFIPAWSLHRLMEILSYTPELSDFAIELQYDAMIIHIANAIEANNINKDYLEEKK